MNMPLLKHYREDVNFRRLMEDLWKENRPVIEQWNPQTTQDENARLLEQIKFSSAKQQGFDLLFTLLQGHRNV